MVVLSRTGGGGILFGPARLVFCCDVTSLFGTEARRVKRKPIYLFTLFLRRCNIKIRSKSYDGREREREREREKHYYEKGFFIWKSI